MLQRFLNLNKMKKTFKSHEPKLYSPRGCLWCIFRLMMHQMFSIGERSGLKAGQLSTRTLLLRSHAVVIAAVCGLALSSWNTQGLPWNWCHLEGSICCSKTFIYLSAFIVPYKTCKIPIPYAPPYNLTLRNVVFKYSTIFLRTLSQIREHLPIFTSERLCLSTTSLL